MTLKRAQAMGRVQPRRLRHRLLVTQLSPPPPGRHREGRSIVLSARWLGRSGSGMVRSIVALAHTLGLSVVAEGVETAEQFAELRKVGCEYAQGFYLSKPVDAGGGTADRRATVGDSLRAAVSASSVEGERMTVYRRFTISLAAPARWPLWLGSRRARRALRRAAFA